MSLRVGLAAVLAASGLLAAPLAGTAGAQVERAPWTNTSCPEMTDSVTRLYTAYFDRQPEQGGFEFWVEAYRQGEWNLDRMSRHFSLSEEFVTTYGELTNADFVDLLYRNVHGRPADQEGRSFWIGELDSGRMTRGRVMIFFSESEEYVTATRTALPLAGYLGWYPEGTTWSCGAGSASVHMSTNVSYADVFLDNLSREPQSYRIVSYDPTYADPLVEAIETIGSDSYHYYANARLSPSYGYLDFELPDDVWWIVVDAPRPMVENRPGWF